MASQTNQTAPQVMDEDAKFDFLEKKAKRKYKNQVRKFRREAETDNAELNLTAMMDMMTILLVFLIKSYGATEISVAMGNELTPPTSASTLQPIEGTTSVTITKKDISVAERGIVSLTKDFTVPPSAMDAGGFMPLVQTALEKEVAKAAEGAKLRPKAPAGQKNDPIQMLTIVADKDLPFETLYAVLKTAGHLSIDSSKGQKPLKYFKFLVLSNS